MRRADNPFLSLERAGVNGVEGAGEAGKPFSCTNYNHMVIIYLMRITFHTSKSGRSYFEDWLESVFPSDRASILAVFDDIRQYGFKAMGCQFRQLEGKLWEIKIRTAGGGWRFFYVMLSLDEMYVLHWYKKKGQRAPKHELEVARRRLKEVLR